MKKFFAFIFQPPIPALIVLIILSVVIWVGFDYLQELHQWDPIVRVYIICGIWTLAILVFLWKRYQSAKRARLIEDRLRGQARQHKESVRPDKRGQVEELEERLGAALTTLKSSKLGKSALYELPWYMIIGPPGSGKTTLLRESSLTFPDQAHGRGVRGVGGTRNCDWWFTDQGILLDTAGRYTTQDEDRTEWFTFLDMLKKSRPQKPVNGAIIAISIADIIQSDEVQLAEHATKIRERVAELTEKLEVIFPVYLLFSKCDLLEGFVETFGGYDKKERAQTWGFAAPNDGSKDSQISSQFDAEFSALGDRLAAERLRNLAAAKSKHKKAKIFSFPMQFALIRKRLHSFLSQLEQENPYAESSGIRGCYFTSGTQEGQPLDQVLASMRSASGLTEETESSVEEAVDTKAYFIDELFTEVVFPDKDLARSSAKAEKRRKMVRKGSLIGTIAASVLILVGLVVLFSNYRSQFTQCEKAYEDAASFDGTVAANQIAEDSDEKTGSFEQLREQFAELHGDYHGWTKHLMGETDYLYEIVRRRYVEKAKATFLEPIKGKIEAAINGTEIDSQTRATTGLSVLQTSAYLDIYRALGHDIAANRKELKDNLSAHEAGQAPLWTWPGENEATKATNAHLATFVNCVIDPGEEDWEQVPFAKVVNHAQEILRKGDITAKYVDQVLSDLDSGAPLQWPGLLTGCDDAKAFADFEGVAKAFNNDQPANEQIEFEAERHKDVTVDQLKSEYEKRRLKTWDQALHSLSPKPENNLRLAIKQLNDLAGLTDATEDNPVDENCAYAKAYGYVCKKLNEALDEPFNPRQNDFVNILTEFRQLSMPIKELCEQKLGDRMVRDAKKQTGSTIQKIYEAIRRTRTSLGQRCDDNLDERVRDLAHNALINGLESLEDALAHEIREEALIKYGMVVGDNLRDYSSKFPLKAIPYEEISQDNSISPAEFAKFFKPDEGEFDKQKVWVSYLGGILKKLETEGGLSDGFLADQEYVAKIQKALFAGVGAEMPACKIEFKLEKLGNSTSSTFQLGQEEMQNARGSNTVKEFSWEPEMSAMIKIGGYRQADASTLDLEKVGDGRWPLLKLLLAGDYTEHEEGSWHSATWIHFVSSNDIPVSANDGLKAQLRFKTRVPDNNPLIPGFFSHSFTPKEVFRAKNK